jgi:large subunit ribosomal protein L2
MAVKNYKPTTPSRRHMTVVDYSVLTKKKPEKSLTHGFKRKVGRSRGGISVRHKGGGAKRLYRDVDFKRKKVDIPAKVVSLEYDPNRSAFIALVKYKDGDKSYILAPQDLKVGQGVVVSEKAPLEIGNRMPLARIPVGFQVYNIEFEPGKGGQLIRSAGSSAQVMAQEGEWTHIKLPSGEVRKFRAQVWGSIGTLSNPDHGAVVIGKAGRSRKLGRRPSVRGSAMNPVDHPHGGGEGRTGIGLKHPKTPWGRPAHGVRTRKKGKRSNKLIVKRRGKKK